MSCPNNITYQVTNKLLKIFFNLLYHRFAWTYDFVAALVSVEMWNEWVFSVLPELNGPRVLELGFGPGHLQLALHQQSFQAFGLDQSKEMVTIAKKRLLESGFTSNLVNGFAQYLPFERCSFNQIVATFPTEFIVDQLTLEEFWRVLKPGGTMIVLPVAWVTGETLIKRAAAWLFRITGQSPEWNDQLLEPFQKRGFVTQVKHMKLESSDLVIIKAEKRHSEEL
jgi:ubiquinone/menaquinone biosynthesis C-methylase UbiE